MKDDGEASNQVASQTPFEHRQQTPRRWAAIQSTQQSRDIVEQINKYVLLVQISDATAASSSEPRPTMRRGPACAPCRRPYHKVVDVRRTFASYKVERNSCRRRTEAGIAKKVDRHIRPPSVTSERSSSHLISVNCICDTDSRARVAGKVKIFRCQLPGARRAGYAPEESACACEC
ncbi:hypothetical protein TNCV_3149941 [Trichonephila clavipes]|nr:hypothetical protein TNCV_3149941 [Trichonephila clavipes]